jgi:hypothetical protein
MIVVLHVDTRSTGHYFQVMAESSIDKIPPGPKLDAITAGKFFGWKNVHKHRGAIIDKKQDKRPSQIPGPREKAGD